MNKKERDCDVDNIVEWRHGLPLLLKPPKSGNRQFFNKQENTFISDKTERKNRFLIKVVCLIISCSASSRGNSRRYSIAHCCL